MSRGVRSVYIGLLTIVRTEISDFSENNPSALSTLSEQRFGASLLFLLFRRSYYVLLKGPVD